ncbi:FecR family protein [Labrys neptuniae]
MDEHLHSKDIERRIGLDARDWIVRLTSGNVSDADLQRFKAWRDQSPDHKLAFERERSFWQQLQGIDAGGGGMPSQAALQPSSRALMGRRTFILGSAVTAAGAVCLVAVPRLQVWWSADFTTAVGDQAEFTLPDGSVATLNTDSAVSIGYRPGLRLIELLKGEAEFKIAPDRSSVFRVAALDGNSSTRAGRFSVGILDDVATVTAAEGRVDVAGPASSTAPDDLGVMSVEVAANEQTLYARGEAPRPAQSADAQTVLAWRKGRIIFEGRPFSRAMAELGRYVPERIVMRPGIDPAVPVSAVFSTADAFAAVQALAKTQGLSVRRIPGVLLLIS